MGMVAPQQPIASAFFVLHGQYGDVSRYAQQRGVCRQWVYREAARVQEVLTHTHEEVDHLRAEVRQLRQQLAESEWLRGAAVLIDADKQAEVAIVGQALGVTLRDCRTRLHVLIPWE